MHSFGHGEWKPWVRVTRGGATWTWPGDWAMDDLSVATPADLARARMNSRP
jgi:hypothetical protein